MRNHVQGAKGEADGRPPGANGAAGTGKVRRKRRRWSVEEKLRIARESLASNETIAAVAERHGVPRDRLSAWRSQLRQGKLVAPPSAKSPARGGVRRVGGGGTAVGRDRGPRRDGSPGGGDRHRRDRFDCRGTGGAPVRVSPNGVRILVATEPVDFRKGHDGLAAVVQTELGLDPYSGVAYVFRAKRADRIKVLWFDGTGLVMAYKRLEQGRFAWPAVRDGVIRLTRAQFEALFEGLDWRRAWSPRVRRPRTAA